MKTIFILFVIALVVIFAQNPFNLSTTVGSPEHTFFQHHGIRRRIQDYRVFVSPAAGPGCFVTAGFDEQFIQLYQTNQLDTNARWFVGGSSGALRFTALITSVLSGVNHVRQFQEYFTHMYYRDGNSAETLVPMMNTLIEICAPKKYLSDIVNHPHLHLCVFVTRLKIAPDAPTWKLFLFFIGLFIVNLIYPQAVHSFCEPICFYTGTHFPIQCPGVRFVPITSDNFYDVMRATTCIPFINTPIAQIGQETGTFVDGAVCHYQLNIPCTYEYPTVYLGNISDSKIKPTAFDIHLPWRKLPSAKLEQCLRIHPTEYFRQHIPEQRFPRVSDWFDRTYQKYPERRYHSWLTTLELSRKQWDRENVLSTT